LVDNKRVNGPVLIVDDDEGFVACVRTLLESAGFSTLTAATGEEALQIAEDESPLVVLLDIKLPGLNGYEVCHALRDQLGHGAAIAFVSGARTEPIDISSGLLAGADDYIVKPFEPSELLARIGALIRRVTRSGERTLQAGDLTQREAEILGLLVDGLDQREIAERLSITPKTVGTHLEHILGKLGVHSRAQAVAAAYRHALIRTPP
jgi:two-component system nitrate/nitrite response regulator NarL